MPIDHPRHLAFVPAAPTRAAIMFDLVTSASSIHGAYWMEGAGGIFCENQAMKWLVSLTGFQKDLLEYSPVEVLPQIFRLW